MTHSCPTRRSSDLSAAFAASLSGPSSALHTHNEDKSMKPNKLALALAGLLLTPVAAVTAQTTPPAASDASGQQTPDQQAPDQKQAQQLQTITVTGSALPRVDLETPSPVTVITAAQIESRDRKSTRLNSSH